jgi:hypothetical protein
MKYREKIVLKNGICYFGKGWKQTIGNFTKVYVKGTDFERGFQFGKLLAHEIDSVFKYYLSYMIRTLNAAPPELKNALSLDTPVLKSLLFSFYGEVVKKRIEKYPQWMVNELEGMAEGANIDPFFLKLMNAAENDEYSLGVKQVESLQVQNRSCCSMAFTVQDGNIYHGKNLDWIPVEEFIDLTCLQQREDEEGNWFALIGPPGSLNSYEYGLNSHGLGISLTGRFFRGKRVSRLTLTNALELQILRYAKNLNEVCHMYNTRTGFDRSDGLLISSTEDQDYRLFEVTPKGVTVTPAVEGKLYCTNTFIHPKFHQYNRNWGTIYENQFRDPRYLRLQELMAANPQTREDAFNILNDTVQPGFQGKVFLGQATINRFVTHVSALMIFPPPEGHGETGVWIARDHTYAAYNEYSFFNFSGLPQEDMKTRPANKIVGTEKFNNFKKFMHLRETRYYASSSTLIQGGEKLLDKEPDNPIFVLFVAQTCFKHGKFHVAMEILEKYPLEWMADYWYCMGKCKLELKAYQDSKHCFIKAMELPCIDGFVEQVRIICLIQLAKVNELLGLREEVLRLKEEIKNLQAQFATPNIGMPDYPYINNIIEQMEQIVL